MEQDIEYGAYDGLRGQDKEYEEDGGRMRTYCKHVGGNCIT
jgi:hypothetical protein